MSQELKLTGYFAGALFSGQELYGNRALAAEINRVSQGVLQMDETAKPEEYASHRTALVRDLKLDVARVADILETKKRRHQSDEYRQSLGKLLALVPALP